MARSRLIPPPLLPSSVPNPLIFSTAACEKKDFSRSRLQTHSTFTNSPFPPFFETGTKRWALDPEEARRTLQTTKEAKGKKPLHSIASFIPPPSSEATLAFFGKWKKVSTFLSHFSLCIPPFFTPPPFFACSFPNTLSGFLAVKNPLALDLWCRTPHSFFPPNPFFSRANQQKRIETSPPSLVFKQRRTQSPAQKGIWGKTLGCLLRSACVCVCA